MPIKHVRFSSGVVRVLRLSHANDEDLITWSMWSPWDEASLFYLRTIEEASRHGTQVFTVRVRRSWSGSSRSRWASDNKAHRKGEALFNLFRHAVESILPSAWSLLWVDADPKEETPFHGTREQLAKIPTKEMLKCLKTRPHTVLLTTASIGDRKRSSRTAHLAYLSVSLWSVTC